MQWISYEKKLYMSITWVNIQLPFKVKTGRGGRRKRVRRDKERRASYNYKLDKGFFKRSKNGLQEKRKNMSTWPW